MIELIAFPTDWLLDPREYRSATKRVRRAELRRCQQYGSVCL